MFHLESIAHNQLKHILKTVFLDSDDFVQFFVGEL